LQIAARQEPALAAPEATAQLKKVPALPLGPLLWVSQ
jgi:hypothetical protein